MIVEPFLMNEARCRARYMQMQCRCAVRGKRRVIRLAQRGHIEKAGDAAATARVGLQYVDGARVEQVAKVVERVAVFARRDLHRRWNGLP